ncbi:hypothetical protein DFP72DRAFT_306240 [Ephemerocybe angulata]|uniref:BTB domain-containing protein n=1 Tax=Ephemerocybe angulata TaxID=980116 RepID=A0A8H6M7M4_9AGAR|nr:hypothetical protein DFP72DRAFT_306240 [Tulosesus angulatus]
MSAHMSVGAPGAENSFQIEYSTSFYPGSHPHEADADLIISSSDNVHFFAHAHTIHHTSPQMLQRILSFSPTGTKDAVVCFPLDSEILDILLHTAYGTSCAEHCIPSIDICVDAIDQMKRYGLDPHAFIRPGQPLFDLLLKHAPHHPLEIYILAGHHGLPDLAERASSHLLAFQLAKIDNEQATRMGHRYLRRLFQLHAGRVVVLKQLLLRAPEGHPVALACGAERQRAVVKAWVMGVTVVGWEIRPDTSIYHLRSVFERCGASIQCPECRHVYGAHIQQLVSDWAGTKVRMDLYRSSIRSD